MKKRVPNKFISFFGQNSHVQAPPTVKKNMIDKNLPASFLGSREIFIHFYTEASPTADFSFLLTSR